MVVDLRVWAVGRVVVVIDWVRWWCHDAYGGGGGLVVEG